MPVTSGAAEAILERGRHLDPRGPSYRTKHLKLDVREPGATILGTGQTFRNPR